MKAYNGRDYIVALWPDKAMDWNSAETYCQDIYDSHLATMLTADDYERAYNYSYFGGFNGLHDKDEDGQFLWIDGTQCDSLDENHIESAYCTQYFNPDPDIEGYCSLIPWGGYKCNEALCSTTYNQFYCNKGIYIYQKSQYKHNVSSYP